ncbi:MAG: FecR family protein [Spirochaetaceae bacterium]|jgi:hypothetical protein|nr:FecR family protein [Spirochaetaceae bacterium]
MVRYAALFAFLSLAPGFPAAAQAVFVEIQGTVEVQAAGSEDWTAAVRGGGIAPGAVISTGFKSSAIVSLGSSRIQIRPVTRLTLEELIQKAGGDEVKLFVRAGRIRADVRSPEGRTIEFTVRSPIATASVRGTSFEFDTVNIRVDSGLVRYASAQGQTVYVAQGESAYVDDAERRMVSPQETAASGGLSPVSPNTGVNIALPAPPPAASPAEVRIRPVWQ